MSERYMGMAAKQAELSVESGEGGPFGAVIVKDGEIVAEAHNMVIASNDPTAHAEVTVIREAAKKLGRFDLSDCEIYSSCEPCPMCLSAIYWAKIPKLYYGCTAQDAADAGFDDKYIYDAIRGTAEITKLHQVQLKREVCTHAFELWQNKKEKTQY